MGFGGLINVSNLPKFWKKILVISNLYGLEIILEVWMYKGWWYNLNLTQDIVFNIFIKFRRNTFLLNIDNTNRQKNDALFFDLTLLSLKIYVSPLNLFIQLEPEDTRTFFQQHLLINLFKWKLSKVFLHIAMQVSSQYWAAATVIHSCNHSPYWRLLVAKDFKLKCSQWIVE